MTTSLLDISAARAADLDTADPAPRRADFRVPPAVVGRFPEIAYLAGNSLGLQPVSTAARLTEELDDWATLAVEGHLEARRPWAPYHELLREPLARLVGAQPDEVVAMNSLTVNLHLMMISFYRPTADRYAIVIEDSAFPSDSYAARSQVEFHGFDPDTAVIRLRPREGQNCLDAQDVETFLATQGDRVALLMLGGVNYYSGEFLDIPRITAAGHAAGAVVGWDLAHAAGNVELHLHDWNVDWAAWCHYKYVNSGPGALAGAFVHRRHLADRSLPKLQGWWSTRYETRFQMAPVVDPVDTADSWQLSNPPILAMAPVLASLEIFDTVGMSTLRARSRRLTAYLEQVLDALIADRGLGERLEIITPREPDRRGTQLSVRITGLAANETARRLRAEHDVIADARQPDVIRLAPTALYNSYVDAWRAATALVDVMEGQAP
jgi:kynureninase